MRWIIWFILLIPVFAACGDLICETSELATCRDCSMITRNYVCDEFQGDMKDYDPDCNASVGQTCYDSLFTYSDGQGDSCYPGNCTEGSGCTTSCSSGEHCASGFCASGTCESACDGCNKSTANYEVYPVSTTTYLGDPTFVSFRVNRLGGATPVDVTSVEGPCNKSYDSTVDLSGGYGIAVIRLDNCRFTGVSSINLTVGGEAWGSVHFLSYPALLISSGDMPSGSVGFSSMSSSMDGVPMEVKTWVG